MTEVRTRSLRTFPDAGTVLVWSGDPPAGVAIANTVGDLPTRADVGSYPASEEPFDLLEGLVLELRTPAWISGHDCEFEQGLDVPAGHYRVWRDENPPAVWLEPWKPRHRYETGTQRLSTPTWTVHLPDAPPYREVTVRQSHPGLVHWDRPGQCRHRVRTTLAWTQAGALHEVPIDAPLAGREAL